jgi:fructokinase
VKIISIGEIVWDVFERSEHLGGAPLNFAVHAARLGHTVDFLSAVGADERGSCALAKMAALGLSTRMIRIVENQPTGVVSVAGKQNGEPIYRIHRPAAYEFLELDPDEVASLADGKPDWIYFGTLHQMSWRAKRATASVIDAIPQARCFYDLNLRCESHTPSLVEELLGRAHVVKLNQHEAGAIQGFYGTSYGALDDFCAAYADRFEWEAVCVTRGPEGCALYVNGRYAQAIGYPVQAVDSVGAGDAFAAAFLHGLGSGWPLEVIGDFANRVGALVASREGAVPPWSLEECLALAVRQ